MERGSPFLMSGRGMATALRVLVAVHCDNENGAHEHLSGCAFSKSHSHADLLD